MQSEDGLLQYHGVLGCLFFLLFNLHLNLLLLADLYRRFDLRSEGTFFDKLPLAGGPLHFKLSLLLLDLLVYTLRVILQIRCCSSSTHTPLCSSLVSLGFEGLLEFKVLRARRFLEGRFGGFSEGLTET